MVNGIKKLIPAFMVVMFLLIGTVAIVEVLAPSNQATNVTGTAFNDSYNANQAQQGISATLLGVVGLLAVIGFLMLTVKVFFKG